MGLYDNHGLGIDGFCPTDAVKNRSPEIVTTGSGFEWSASILSRHTVPSFAISSHPFF